MSDKSIFHFPIELRQRAWGALRRRFERLGLGGRHMCVCCGQSILGFLPYAGGWKAAPPVARQLQIVGSDLQHYECPRCGSNDRERHLQLYCARLGLDKRMAGAKILHFAPEHHFGRFVVDAGPVEYVRADLFPHDSAVKRIDIQAIPFPDKSFDIVIANHVLEHVAHDGTALREIRRVLTPGGQAILQTPYSAVLQHTFEDDGIVSDEIREFAYGQSDHVRLYGRDIFDEFASVGFISRVAQHDEVLSDIDGRRYGLNEREPFFLFERRAGCSIRQ